MKNVFFSTKQIVLYVVLSFCSILALFPIAVMLLISGKDYAQYLNSVWSVPNPVQWGYYLFGLRVTIRYIGNSIIVSAAVLILTLIVATFASYACSRIEVKGRKITYLVITALLMVPAVVTLIPLFLVIRYLGLLNTYWGMILPQIAMSLPVAIFLLKTFFDDVPSDLFAAAKIDGAGHMKIIWYVLMPLCIPIFATLSIINVLASWNLFVLPLIVIKDASLRTIPLGMTFVKVEQYLDYKPGMMMAAYVVASLPMIIAFFILLKPFMKGMTQGGLKG